MSEHFSSPVKTSSTNYEVRLKVTLVGDDAKNEKCKAILTPQLCRVGAGATRYQHRWDVFVKADGKEITRGYRGGSGYEALPNRTSGTNVESAGHMYMKAGTWYDWGESYEFEIANDGKAHRFEMRMECIDTIPRTCPQSGYVVKDISTPQYLVELSKPELLTPVFNENTRALTYSWKPVDTAKCKYIKLYRNWFGEDISATPIKSSYVTIGTSNELPDTTTSFTETIPEGVVRVSYEVIVYSNSEDQFKSNDEFPIASDDKVWVYVNNKWVKAIPWVKVDGAWKKVTKTYVNINGTWKRTIM